MSGIERRRHTRINQNLEIKLNLDDSLFVAETINLSCSGAYCHLQREIPLMTRLRIVFCLPPIGKQKKDVVVECSGVVVRVEKGQKKDEYNIAIFFNQIEEKEQKKIERFVSAYQKEAS
ncbi:PilZ domain-containing protein [Candidatus Auribacterota bacterium]